MLTAGTSASATVGSAFTFTLTAANSATSFSASGLPPGLSINSSTGVINGVPTTAGSYQVHIGAANSAGSASAILTLTVSAKVSAPSLTAGTSASAAVGSAFTFTLTATNSPTSFSASSLPPGLSINSSTGVINGVPTTTGSYQVHIGAANAAGSASANFILTVAAH